MARPTKQGLDYFSFDVDFFQNIKVRKIKMACGPQSASILICLLCNIYRNKGYYIEWDEDMPFLIADEVGVSEGAVIETLKKAIQVGFFDAGMAEGKIITSSEIQSRYLKIVVGAKRVGCEIAEQYDLIVSANKPVNKRESEFPPEETSLSTEETPKSSEESTQSKGKESKVKKSKEEIHSLLVARKQKFALTLEPFSDQYPREMLVDFYKYWTEPNKSQTQFRQELEKTWDVARRLDTWARRERSKVIPIGQPKKSKFETNVETFSSLLMPE